MKNLVLALILIACAGALIEGIVGEIAPQFSFEALSGVSPEANVLGILIGVVLLLGACWLLFGILPAMFLRK